MTKLKVCLVKEYAVIAGNHDGTTADGRHHKWVSQHSS